MATGLLSLPFELRDDIYHRAFPPFKIRAPYKGKAMEACYKVIESRLPEELPSEISWSSEIRAGLPLWILANKQILDEAMTTVHHRAIFRITGLDMWADRASRILPPSELLKPEKALHFSMPRDGGWDCVGTPGRGESWLGIRAPGPEYYGFGYMNNLQSLGYNLSTKTLHLEVDFLTSCSDHPQDGTDDTCYAIGRWPEFEKTEGTKSTFPFAEVCVYALRTIKCTKGGLLLACSINLDELRKDTEQYVEELTGWTELRTSWNVEKREAQFISVGPVEKDVWALTAKPCSVNSRG